MRITALSHPTLFRAFETISHDCGRQAGHEVYTVPHPWDAVVPVADTALASLSASDFETVCIGETTEAEEIIHNSTLDMEMVGELLDAFFEEFEV